MDALREQSLALAKDLAITPATLDRVARATSSDLARWAFSQWELRQRGLAKFAKSQEMLFDRDGLEMATHERVAGYHASRFPSGKLVLDATVGIGADSIALAARGPLLGFDLDLDRLEMARHNLGVHGLSAELTAQDCLAEAWEADYVWADPARRIAGVRKRDLADFAPDPLSLAERMRTLKFGGIKLSPLLSDQELEGFEGELEFVSFGGECREALVWLGETALESRAAVHVESGSRLQSLEAEDVVDQADEFLYEADPAAIRAHCLGALCNEFDLRPLADSNGYLTGADAGPSPWLSKFQVLADHPADVRKTREALRANQGGTPVIKARAKGVDVEKLRKELRGEGQELVVLVYANGPKLRHAVALRC